MSGSGPDRWFLRTQDDSVFGPVGMDELRAWAADGRVAPEHTVSCDRRSWRPASSLPELEMQWTVAFETGVSFGPLNLRALRDYIHDGSVGLDASLRHLASGQATTVREKLVDIFGGGAAEKDIWLRKITTLEGRVAEAAQRAAQAEQQRQDEREDAARRRKEQNAELSALRADLRQAQIGRQRAEEEQKREQALLEQLTRQEGQAQEAGAAMESRLRDLSSRLDASEAAGRRLDADLKAANETATNWQNRAGDTERLLRDATRAAALLRADLENAQASRASHNAAAQVAALQQEVTAISAAAKQAADERQAIEREWAAELAASAIERQRIEADLRDARDAIDRQHERAEEATRLLRIAGQEEARLRDDLEKTKTFLATAREEGIAVAAQVASLQRDMTTLDACARQAAAAHEAIERELRDQNAATADELEALRRDLHEARGVADRLGADLLQLREEFRVREADLQGHLARATHDAEDAVGQLTSSRAACAAKDAELRDVSGRAADADSRLASLKIKFDSQCETAAALAMQKDDLQARLQQETVAMQARVLRLEEERQRARGDAQDAEQALRRLQEILDTEQAAARKREKELDGRLTEQVKLHEDEAAAWEEREDNLHRKIVQLQRNCEESLSEGRDLRKKLEEEQNKQRQVRPGINPLVGLEAQAQAELKRWMKNK